MSCSGRIARSLTVIIALALWVSGCSPLAGTCLLCPTNEPYKGAAPGQGPGVHARIVQVALWDRDCNRDSCDGTPDIVAVDDAYPLRLGGFIYMTVAVAHPGIEYRELAVRITSSWTGHIGGDLPGTNGLREDQVLLRDPLRTVSGRDTLPEAPGTYSIRITIEERGRDLPAPVVIEQTVAIRPVSP
jgi:hypothetical protein